MTLGKAGVAGSSDGEFNQPTDVVTAPNGDIFVADGHVPGYFNSRIVKFTADGKFIKSWGMRGSGPGEFEGAHALAFDSQGGSSSVTAATTESRSSIRRAISSPSGSSSAARAAFSSTPTTSSTSSIRSRPTESSSGPHHSTSCRKATALIRASHVVSGSAARATAR
jgi:hypothetical protein